MDKLILTSRRCRIKSSYVDSFGDRLWYINPLDSNVKFAGFTVHTNSAGHISLQFFSSKKRKDEKTKVPTCILTEVLKAFKEFYEKIELKPLVLLTSTPTNYTILNACRNARIPYQFQKGGRTVER